MTLITLWMPNGDPFPAMFYGGGLSFGVFVRNTILAAYAGGVLAIWRPRERGWVEVRGTLDASPHNPLQRVMDALPGPLVGGELMAGNIAVINADMYAQAYPILAALLDE